MVKKENLFLTHNIQVEVTIVNVYVVQLHYQMHELT